MAENGDSENMSDLERKVCQQIEVWLLHSQVLDVVVEYLGIDPRVSSGDGWAPSSHARAGCLTPQFLCKTHLPPTLRRSILWEIQKAATGRESLGEICSVGGFDGSQIRNLVQLPFEYLNETCAQQVHGNISCSNKMETVGGELSLHLLD